MRVRRLSMIALALALVALSGMAARRADAVRGHSVERSIQYLPSPEALRIGSFGYRGLVSDFLWLKLVLYYGESRHGEHGLAFFEQLASTVVELDPQFEDGYRFTALVLSQDMGAPEAGIRMLKKGMVARPYDWWLPFEAGFIEYVTALNDEEAFRWFKRAAEVPGAPEFPRRFAAFVASRAGELQVSLVLYRTIARTTTDPYQRKAALKKAAQLEAAIRGEAPVPEWARRKRIVNGKTDKGDDGA